jgi:hypothetical protein
VSRTHGFLRKARRLWLSGWLLWALLIFASLAAARLLPGGYVRAAVAAPIAGLVPGSLTLGAVFSERGRPRGTVFVCYAALLSAVWSVFASLALYVLKVAITAGSTYWCLLVISAVLAAVAQARLWHWPARGGRWAARRLAAAGPDRPDAGADGTGTPAAVRAGGYQAIVALVAGLSLLGGGAYAYDHLSHQASADYTWMAWTGPPVKGVIAIGSGGTTLPFQVVRRQPGTASFRLTATWLGNPSQLLAGPLTMTIGANQTVRGTLVVPPPPDGCTYRIVVTLTATRQADPLTRPRQTWSLNADVDDPGKSRKACQR